MEVKHQAPGRDAYLLSHTSIGQIRKGEHSERSAGSTPWCHQHVTEKHQGTAWVRPFSGQCCPDNMMDFMFVEISGDLWVLRLLTPYRWEWFYSVFQALHLADTRSHVFSRWGWFYCSKLLIPCSYLRTRRASTSSDRLWNLSWCHRQTGWANLSAAGGLLWPPAGVSQVLGWIRNVQKFLQFLCKHPITCSTTHLLCHSSPADTICGANRRQLRSKWTIHTPQKVLMKNKTGEGADIASPAASNSFVH